MTDNLHEHLSKEITRKQFLQYLAAAGLAVFGLDNLISLLTGGKVGRSSLRGSHSDLNSDFGTRKFGV